MVGIVGAERQTELGPRREHPIGFGDATARKIVDHHAEVAPRAAEVERLALPDRKGRIEPRREPLGSGLFVTGGAVDLPGEVEPAKCLHFESWTELTRIEIVVLNRVAGLQDAHILEPGNRANVRLLNLRWKRGRDPVGIDGVIIEASGSRKT